MTITSLDELNRLSAMRAARGLRRTRILAALVLFVMLALAVLLQIQTSRTNGFAHDMCMQRRVNTLHTNATWDALEAIERHNTFIDDRIRVERLAAYEDAKLIVPTC